MMTTAETDLIALVRLGAGLTHKCPLSCHPDWQKIYDLAHEHAVLGILANAFGELKAEKPEFSDESMGLEVENRLFQDSLCIIQHNKLLNQTQARVVRLLRQSGIRCIVQKGQAVAQDYPNPHLRMGGDIDLLVPEETYPAAQRLLQQHCTQTDEDHLYRDLHSTFACGDIEIELHATEFGALPHNCRLQYSRLCQNMWDAAQFRTYRCEDEEITLAPATFDAFYIFLHLVKHYYWHGIGLRQILDLCVFLQVHNSEIDHNKIQRWTEQFRLTQQWRAFTNIWNQPQLLSLVVGHGNMGRLKSQGFSRHRIVRLLQIVPMNYRFARRHLPFSRWMFFKDFCYSTIHSVVEVYKKYK